MCSDFFRCTAIGESWCSKTIQVSSRLSVGTQRRLTLGNIYWTIVQPPWHSRYFRVRYRSKSGILAIFLLNITFHFPCQLELESARFYEWKQRVHEYTTAEMSPKPRGECENHIMECNDEISPNHNADQNLQGGAQGRLQDICCACDMVNTKLNWEKG